jgi:hypothetical protein
MNNRSIERGQSIVVSAMGRTVKGTVLSASDYGRSDGWYIEIGECNVPGGYSYWKQGLDGGRIVSVDGKEWA